MKKKHRVCPVEIAGSLDSFFRRIIHNPKRLVGKYVKKGMTVLDFGCGPGLFTIEMARMVGKNGKVIAVDLQTGMLDIVRKKISGKEIEKRIKLVKSIETKIDFSEKFDFALIFYVFHEISEQNKVLRQIKDIMKKKGKLMLIEPSFHVNKQEFKSSLKKIKALGFKEVKRPFVFFSRAVVLENG